MSVYSLSLTHSEESAEDIYVFYQVNIKKVLTFQFFSSYGYEINGELNAPLRAILRVSRVGGIQQRCNGASQRRP